MIWKTERICYFRQKVLLWKSAKENCKKKKKNVSIERSQDEFHDTHTQFVICPCCQWECYLNVVHIFRRPHHLPSEPWLCLLLSLGILSKVTEKNLFKKMDENIWNCFSKWILLSLRFHIDRLSWIIYLYLMYLCLSHRPS